MIVYWNLHGLRAYFVWCMDCGILHLINSSLLDRKAWGITHLGLVYWPLIRLLSSAFYVAANTIGLYLLVAFVEAA